jgi:hypothetical protein
MASSYSFNAKYLWLWALCSFKIEAWSAALGTPQQVALRGHIVLLAGLGKAEAAIVAEMNVNRKTSVYGENVLARGTAK